MAAPSVTDLTALLALETKTEVLREYRWTARMFYRVLDAGAFGMWPKVELIRGRLMEHPGQTPLHSSTLGRIARRFRGALQPTFRVYERSPIGIAEDTHADTDILVVTASRSDDEDRHPGPDDAALLVEVADLTLTYDTGEKALVYAQAGITDYWVVAAEARAVIVRRSPTPYGYKGVKRLSGNDALSPLVMPEAVWTVNALFGREEASEEN